MLPAVLACAASSGCLKSSPVRPASANIPDPASSKPASSTQSSALNTAREDDSVDRTSSPNLTLYSGRQLPPLLSPPPPPPISLSPTPAPTASPDAPGQTRVPDASPVPPPAEIAPPPATPLLDAAIERVEAIKRIQSETIAAELEQEEKQKAPPIQVLGASTTKPHQVAAGSPPQATESKPSNTPAITPAPAATPTKPLADPAATSHDHAAPDLPWVIPAPAKFDSSPSTVSKSSPPKEDLEIAEFRLCRNISGFGCFDAFAESVFKPGQQILIYCEMNGLEYEPIGDSFVSKMSSRLELVASSNAKTVWEQTLGTAEDSCRRIRRDYYVNYCVELPATIAPGHYRLRLIQTDQVSNHTTAAERPLDIAR